MQICFTENQRLHFNYSTMIVSVAMEMLGCTHAWNLQAGSLGKFLPWIFFLRFHAFGELAVISLRRKKGTLCMLMNTLFQIVFCVGGLVVRKKRGGLDLHFQSGH